MIVKRTKDEKKIAMAKELGEVISQRQLLDKREKQLKEYFRRCLGKQAAVLIAGDLRVVSTVAGRSLLDADALTEKLGDLTPYKKESSWTEITVETAEA